MIQNQNLNQTVISVRNFHWYEGMVTGVVQSEVGYTVCVLLAFDADRYKRRYALVQIPEETAVELIRDFDTLHTDPLHDVRIGELLPHSESVFLTFDELGGGSTITITEADDDQRQAVMDLVVEGFEQATSAEAIKFWL